MELLKKDIKKLIGEKEKPIILDIGTYDGFDAAELAMHLGNCEIHCFEADKRSQELFERENGDNPKLHLWKCAVTSEPWSKVKLYKSDSQTRRHYEFQNSWSASSSIRKPKNHLKLFPDVQFIETEEVESTTLDMWDWFHDFDVIDFIWCDVNGAEEDVIKGATEVLKKTRYLYIEFSDKELYEGQINKEKLLSLLPDFGEMGIYNFAGNFGNVLLKNKNL